MNAGERLAQYGLSLPPGHSLVSLAERPDLREPLGDHNASAWPEFMLNDPIANALWPRLFSDFAAFQMVLLGPDRALVAGLNSAPLAWDGTDAGLPDGWDDQFRRTVADRDTGIRPDTLGALQIVVRRDLRGSRYAGTMVSAMRANAAVHGFRALIACVRPTDKIHQPLVPIEDYAHRLRADGLPEDAWIRLHVRLGGRVVRASPASMRIEGSVADWVEWTGLGFPRSGTYVPEGAIAPVTIDLDADRGVYLDPNVWVVHALA